jgi:hypothetical protein
MPNGEDLVNAGIDSNELAQAGMGPDSELLGTTSQHDLDTFDDMTESDMLDQYIDRGDEYDEKLSSQGSTGDRPEARRPSRLPADVQSEMGEMSAEIERLNGANNELKMQLNQYGNLYRMFEQVVPALEANGVTLDQYVADLLWFDRLLGENPVDAILYLKQRTPGLRWADVEAGMQGFDNRMYQRTLTTQMAREMDAYKQQQEYQKLDEQTQRDIDYIQKFYAQRNSAGMPRYPEWERLIPIMRALANPPYNIENLDTLYRRAAKVYNDQLPARAEASARGSFGIERHGGNTRRSSRRPYSKGDYARVEDQVINSALDSLRTNNTVQY